MHTFLTSLVSLQSEVGGAALIRWRLFGDCPDAHFFDESHLCQNMMFRHSSCKRHRNSVLALFLLTLFLVEKVMGQLTIEDVALHSTPEDCWSAIYDLVWNLSTYAPNHPGNGGGVSIHLTRPVTVQSIIILLVVSLHLLTKSFTIVV